jgi:hypothetical protein
LSWFSAFSIPEAQLGQVMPSILSDLDHIGESTRFEGVNTSGAL